MTDQNKNELKYTSFRAKELQLSPIKGNFDAAHLKAINQHIFQDMPGLGADYKRYTPGQFRPETNGWKKTRELISLKTLVKIHYSDMSAIDIVGLNNTLHLSYGVALSHVFEKGGAGNLLN